MDFEYVEPKLGNYPGTFCPGQWACASNKCTWVGDKSECIGMEDPICPRCKKGDCFPCEDGEWPQDESEALYNKE